jgi:hypothetical protein
MSQQLSHNSGERKKGEVGCARDNKPSLAVDGHDGSAIVANS